MTPTGVMHAVAQDGAMTVSFNISLYILCEMRGTFRSATLFTGHCRLSGKQHTCLLAKVGHVLGPYYLKQPPMHIRKKNFFLYVIQYPP